MNDLINNFNVIYNERNFYAKNYIKLIVEIFKQFQTKILINYINHFNITAAHCNMIEKNKKFWFDKQLNQRLYNRFINFSEQRTLHDLINVMRNVDWKLSFNSFKDFNNRSIIFINKINQETFFTKKVNQFKKTWNDRINKKWIKFNNIMKKLIEDWTQWLIDKIKESDQCIWCFKKNHHYNNKNVSCKN